MPKPKCVIMVTATILILGAVVVAIFNPASISLVLWKPAPDWEIVANTLLASRMPRLDEIDQARFIERPDLTQVICEGLEDHYTVVVGPRGAGKSSLVKHALANRTGVIYLQVAGEAVLPKLIARLGLLGRDLDSAGVAALLKKAHAAVGVEPIIVVEKQTSGHMLDECRDLKALVQPLKELSADEKAARVVIVLSDANAAASLPEDSHRQDLVWVDEFTLAEAEAYLDKQGVLIDHNGGEAHASITAANHAARKSLFEGSNRRPVTLSDLRSRLRAKCRTSDAMDPCVTDVLDSFILTEQRHAYNVLKDLLTLPEGVPSAGLHPEHFQCLVWKLLQTTDDVGVPQSSVHLAAPAKASAVIQEHHAVQYHYPTEAYRFASAAHQLAAKKWLEEHPDMVGACNKAEINQAPKD